MKFYGGWAICGKGETHISPTLVDPYGGIMTKHGGVIRDPIGTDGQRLIHIEHERERGPRVDEHDVGGDGRPHRQEQVLRHGWRDRGDAGAADLGGRVPGTHQKGLQRDGPLVRSPFGSGGHPPVAPEFLAKEETDGHLGVPDVECEEHG